MRKNAVVITVLVVLAVIVLFIILVKPEWLEKAWLWVLGLTGSAAVVFKKLMDKISGGGIREVSKENEEIKRQIQDLEGKIKATNERMDLERELYSKDIQLLEQKIALKQKEIELAEEKRKKLEGMSWEEYYYSLTDEQKQALRNRMDEDTIFIN